MEHDLGEVTRTESPQPKGLYGRRRKDEGRVLLILVIKTYQAFVCHIGLNILLSDVTCQD